MCIRDSKKERSLLKALLFILLSLLLLLLLIGKRGAHSWSHHREQILRERDERLRVLKREKIFDLFFSLFNTRSLSSRSLRICSRWWDYECAPLLPIKRRRRRERRIKRSALRRERSFLSVSGLFCFYLTDPGSNGNNTLATSLLINCCSVVIEVFLWTEISPFVLCVLSGISYSNNIG